MKRTLLSILFIIFVFFLMALGSRNSATVPLDLLFFSGQYKMSLIMPGLLLCGFFFGLLSAMIINYKVKLTNKMKQNKLDRKAIKQTKADEQPATSLE